MRLPRRVPWASLSELEQICAWIYSDENDIDAKILAINRLSAWKATTCLPHALESALSILVAIAQDNSHTCSTSSLSIRQSYATAIIRLVNGLVDPLQLGAFARSIASIANQLGLPSWLVELRHAATHEDLPSLVLLRDAAWESMTWLLHNYFLPTINPTTVTENRTNLRSLEPALKQYKKLLKITLRDASLRMRYKTDILSVLKDIERWIAEAQVTGNVAAREIGWETTSSEVLSSSSQVDPKERWALERLCDALLEKGSLVPLSKKKRDFPQDTFLPPKFSVQLWTPLLQHLQSLHSEFYLILAGRIASTLLPENENFDEDVQRDSSYDICIARWAKWIVEVSSGCDSTTSHDLRREITVMLMQSFGHVWSVPNQQRKIAKESAMALLDSLCSGVPSLEATLTMLRSVTSDVNPSNWSSDDMSLMDQRLNTLLASDLSSSSKSAVSEEHFQMTAEEISGWRLLDESSGWRPCPIGVHFSPG
ncbi:Protein LAS1 [Termitomyces sp. T112]|nr:hypothetical protein C0989_003041 [Termitomyces sp. Mn162]KAG5729791.1 Protein LAS1 [Termitomyces sp. T112]